MSIEPTQELESWTNELNGLEENIRHLEKKGRGNPSGIILSELTDLRNKRNIAQLEVYGWEIRVAQQDLKEVEPYFERHLADIIAKIKETPKTPIGSEQSSTTSGSRQMISP